jgi:predicted RNase H-like HicB family nuclease
MTLSGDILLEFDEETREYFAVWEPVIFGMGKTEQEAMQDLIAAADLFIDSNHKIINDI